MFPGPRAAVHKSSPTRSSAETGTPRACAARPTAAGGDGAAMEDMRSVVHPAQVLYKAVSEPPIVLTDVEEATSGAADAIDHVDRCAGEPLSDVE
eukprot:g26688.t1